MSDRAEETRPDVPEVVVLNALSEEVEELKVELEELAAMDVIDAATLSVLRQRQRVVSEELAGICADLRAQIEEARKERKADDQ